jgi:aryl-alcohol dehydrogenase-like predicted oxidoreductase
MKYRLLGETGIWVSELCFGAMSFGGRAGWEPVGQVEQKGADRMVSRALEGGINFFDTANVYSSGLSEEILGKALGSKRNEVILATKVRGRMRDDPNGEGLSRAHIMREVEESLRRLGTDHIDLYQIHGYDRFTPLEETLRTLDDLVRTGKVRYIGASNLAAWQLMKSLAISDQNGLERFESLQAYYSIGSRDLEREIVPLLEDQGLGLMVWSPLSGGLLSGKYRRSKEPEEESRRKKFDFPPIDKEKAYDIVEAMDEIAANHDASVAQIALAWLLHRQTVTSVIIGVRKMEQLEDNLGSVEISLSVDELEKLDEVSRLDPEYPGWMLKLQDSGRDPNEREG